MDITLWYAIALGCLAALFLFSYHFLRITRISHTNFAFHFFRDLYYPLLHRYLRGSSQTTRFDLVLIVSFLVGNAICLIVEWKDVPSLINRLGVMSIINLVPLTLGEHMNFVANFFGVHLGAYNRIHEWLGGVVILEGLVHAVVAVSSQPFDLHTRSSVEALVTVVILGTILLFSVPLIRRHFYEIFQKLHLLLATFLVAAIYLHSSSKKLFASPVVYLLSAVCLQIGMGILRLLQVLRRNVKYGKITSLATIKAITYKTEIKDIPISDAVHVHVRPANSWKPRPGQYVYLSILGVSYTSIFQSHPFYVAWSYRDGDDDVIVLVVEKRKGFTEDLFSHISSEIGPPLMMRAIVEGPYGKELDLEIYGTVLLFATGMGIVGQLPYVTQLLEGYHNCEVKSRRISLFWELESQLQAAWVADMMMELLQKDTDKILDINLFILGKYVPGTKAIDGSRRISMIEGGMDKTLIESAIKNRKGSTIVSMCTDNNTSEKIREVVRQELDMTIHLEELEYSPPSLQRSKAGLSDVA